MARRTIEQLDDRFDRWMLWFMPIFLTSLWIIMVVIVVGMIAALVWG